MPITSSAKKALRQSLRRRTRNLKRNKNVRDVRIEIRKLLTAGKAKEAEALLPKAFKAFDKAAQRGVMKKNAAARLKSRLVQQLRKATKK